jgi:hypothetical protein
MILPDIEAGALHTGRRVTAFPGLKRTSKLTTTALTVPGANRNGIILLTFTA